MSVVAGLNFYVADRIANLGANVVRCGPLRDHHQRGRLGKGSEAAAADDGGIQPAARDHEDRKRHRGDRRHDHGRAQREPALGEHQRSGRDAELP